MQNHGLLTTGKTIDEAIWAFVTMERSCHSQLMAEAAHPNGYKDLLIIPGHVAKATFNTIGGARAGYAQFQPMYNMIIKEQPDCLE